MIVAALLTLSAAPVAAAVVARVRVARRAAGELRRRRAAWAPPAWLAESWGVPRPGEIIPRPDRVPFVLSPAVALVDPVPLDGYVDVPPAFPLW